MIEPGKGPPDIPENDQQIDHNGGGVVESRQQLHGLGTVDPARLQGERGRFVTLATLYQGIEKKTVAALRDRASPWGKHPVRSTRLGWRGAFVQKKAGTPYGVPARY